MKRHYRLQNLGCAHCAAKMEHDIQRLPGVREATVNFMTLKLSLEAEDSEFEALFRQAVGIIHKYEPKVTLQRA